jgi:hypothetical protein
MVCPNLSLRSLGYLVDLGIMEFPSPTLSSTWKFILATNMIKQRLNIIQVAMFKSLKIEHSLEMMFCYKTVLLYVRN